jgi:hypothetical protein
MADMMSRVLDVQTNSGRALREHLLETVASGTVLVGTPARLARSLGVTVCELRATLRDLMEQRKVAVWAEASGQISIRLERRQAETLAPLPPAVDRRRPQRDALSDLWIV